ncbi:MAG TPA: sugar phosphate isomerase/epimerase [Candidatus Aquicultor sp.]
MMNRIKLACSSNVYTGIALTEAIRKLAAIGYQGIEIVAGHERLHQSDGHSGCTQAVKDALIFHDLEVSNIAIQHCHLNSDVHNLIRSAHVKALQRTIWQNRHYLERIKYYVSVARTLNCPSVTITPGVADPTIDARRLLIAMITKIEELGEYAQNLGVSVGLMYGPGLFFPTADAMRAVFSQHRNINIAFHVGRSSSSCETPCSIMDTYRNYIKHITVADTGYGGRDYLIPGAGTIEWISFFKTLHRVQYGGFVTVDLSSYKDMPDYAIKRSYYYLTNIMHGVERAHQPQTRSA